MSLESSLGQQDPHGLLSPSSSPCLDSLCESIRRRTEEVLQDFAVRLGISSADNLDTLGDTIRSEAWQMEMLLRTELDAVLAPTIHNVGGLSLGHNAQADDMNAFMARRTEASTYPNRGLGRRFSLTSGQPSLLQSHQQCHTPQQQLGDPYQTRAASASQMQESMLPAGLPLGPHAQRLMGQTGLMLQQLAAANAQQQQGPGGSMQVTRPGDELLCAAAMAASAQPMEGYLFAPQHPSHELPVQLAHGESYLHLTGRLSDGLARAGGVGGDAAIGSGLRAPGARASAISSDGASQSQYMSNSSYILSGASLLDSCDMSYASNANRSSCSGTLSYSAANSAANCLMQSPEDLMTGSYYLDLTETFGSTAMNLQAQQQPAWMVDRQKVQQQPQQQQQQQQGARQEMLPQKHMPQMMQQDLLVLQQQQQQRQQQQQQWIHGLHRPGFGQRSPPPPGTAAPMAAMAAAAAFSAPSAKDSEKPVRSPPPGGLTKPAVRPNGTVGGPPQSASPPQPTNSGRFSLDVCPPAPGTSNGMPPMRSLSVAGRDGGGSMCPGPGSASVASIDEQVFVLPSRFGALPVDVRQRLLSLVQSHSFINLSDFDDKVVGKIVLMAEVFGSGACLTMLNQLDQRLCSKQDMKNARGYLDVAVSSHLDTLKMSNFLLGRHVFHRYDDAGGLR